MVSSTDTHILYKYIFLLYIVFFSGHDVLFSSLLITSNYMLSIFKVVSYSLNNSIVYRSVIPFSHDTSNYDPPRFISKAYIVLIQLYISAVCSFTLVSESS